VTVTTQLYSGDLIPPVLAWQALSFMRCEWPFLFTGDNRLRARPADGPAATQVLRADGDVLLSYAEVLRITAVRAGSPVSVAGLSNVFTFPPYRGEGHASAIMRTVGELINDSDCELAILFCEKELVPFYAAFGWQLAAVGSIQVPGNAPAAMFRPSPGRATPLGASLAAAPLILDAAW
jgi:hypothetical protein